MKISMKLKRIFSSEIGYKESISKYTKVDGIIAIVYYLIFMFVYFMMGKIYSNKQVYLGIPCNLLLALLCVLIIIVRKQKLATIGLTLKNAKKSILFGTVLGIAIVVFNNVIPSLLSGCVLNQFTSIMYNIFYFFIVIAFVEEIAFRGFIQTRLYGLIKNDMVAVFVSAVMFSLMHIPFQMAKGNVDVFTFIAENMIWLILLCMWHIVMNFLHRKYNNLFANTIFHGFMDWGNSLFF